MLYVIFKTWMSLISQCHIYVCTTYCPKPHFVVCCQACLHYLSLVIKSVYSKFTQRNILRLYLKLIRFDSSYYNPWIRWMHGAQMVAFNIVVAVKRLKRTVAKEVNWGFKWRLRWLVCLHIRIYFFCEYLAWLSLIYCLYIPTGLMVVLHHPHKESMHFWHFRSNGRIFY